ncbi:MAG TPA: hypothetical protein VM308_05250 [Sphingomicrobium sp.]|nr:hypothetical protein [Sphingomicrobium sp.]
MAGRLKGFVGVFVAGSLMFSSTAATAAASRAPVPQYDPWAVLSVMSAGAPAATLCGAAAAAAAAAAQPANCVLPQLDLPPPVAQSAPPQPIPVPPIEAPGVGLGISPLVLGLLALAAGIGLYFALRGNNEPNSPA